MEAPEILQMSLNYKDNTKLEKLLQFPLFSHIMSKTEQINFTEHKEGWTQPGIFH